MRPPDLAYTRYFLMRQADPVQTLGSIAGLLRPGGWLVAHEPLSSPAPRSHPYLDALTSYWDLLHEVLHRAGVPAGAIENLPRSAREVGFEVAALHGAFGMAEYPEAFDLHAGTLTAARERGIPAGHRGRQIR